MEERTAFAFCVMIAALTGPVGCGAKSELDLARADTFDAGGPASDASDGPRLRGFAPAIDVAVGGFGHTCAVLEDGSLHCWGYNDHGQLGLGDRESRPTPTRVSGLEGVTQVEAGYAHTCARTAAGEVYCWGWNRDGQVGDGTGGSAGDHPDVTTHDRLSPTRTLVTDVREISIGFAHGCALHVDGGVSCWGAPYFGAIGDGMTSDGRTPVRVPSLDDVVALAGAQPCVLLGTGEVACWGNNSIEGGVGDGTDENRSRPVAVLEASPASAVGSGSCHSCATSLAGELRCWGANSSGQLGVGSLTYRLTPTLVLSPPVRHFIVGDAATCAYSTDDQAWCWGANSYGSLGDGTARVDYTTPRRMRHWDDMEVFALGGAHSCGIRRSDRAVLCTGYNGAGQLGDGTIIERHELTPVRVPDDP